MKRIIIFIAVLIGCLPASAQLKVVKVNHDADTLLYSTVTGNMAEEIIDLYKNKKGYLIKVTSTNMFDVRPRFYIGTTKEEAIESANILAEFCENDVGTSAEVLDACGETFIMSNAYMANESRKPEFVKGDRVYITHKTMAGWMCVKRRALLEMIKVIEKL